MKFLRLFITLAFTGFGSALLAQQTPITGADTANYPYWIEMMQDPSVNFFKVQSAFNQYWENRPITKGCGWKPFKRWEYMMQSRVSPTGERPSESRTLNAYNAFIANPANLPLSTGGNWTNLGPFNIPLGDRGYKGLGRINAIGFHPSDANTIYIGAPSGGLWVTHDGGASWTSNTDILPTLGVSAIMVDHSNPQVMYIGTGDRDAGDASGLGVMKSFDGGITWQSSNTGMGDKTVGRLIIHPANPAVLLAATSGGLYKTTDGGSNWSSKLSGNIKEIVFKTNDPSIIYASGSGKFYRSDDLGETWIQITAGLPSGARGVIGVTQANPNVVYFLLANSDNEFQGLFKSTDAGLSFVEKSNSPNIMDWSCDGSGTGGQAWYDLEIAVDPANENIIYSGGIDVWKSTNGGVTWTINSHWYGGCNRPSVHADQHVFEYNPLTNRLYIGNDGGIYWTNNGGETWTEISDGLAISQTYKLGQSATVDDLVINGYQDNGTSSYEGTTWTAIGGGDGMECAVDPIDFHYRYSTLYYGDIFRHYNNPEQGKIAGNGTNGIDESGGWVTPFLIDESDPKTMFVGYKNVWRSNNIKAPNVNSVTWTKISNGLTGDNLNVLEQSPKNPNILYAAGGNKLFRTDNSKADAPSWISLANKLPVNQTITDIEAHPTKENVVYVTFDNRVFVSSDRGNSWNDITGLLPDVHISCIVYSKHSLNGIYIGTDMGVFYRDASFCGWNFFSNGLPVNAKVTELEIYYDDTNPANDRIKASTYGRGLWKSEMYFTTPGAGFEADQTVVPTGCGVNFTDLSTGVPFTWDWYFEGGNPSSSNQRNPTGILYDTPGKYDVRLIVANSEGTDTLLLEQYINVAENLVPLADFSADKQAFCNTEQPVVHFTDESAYCPNAWNWSFNPSSVTFMNGTSATSQHPEVRFNAPGNYSVTLIASNTNGPDTATKEAYINLGGMPLPFTEDFEHGFAAQGWQVLNPDESVTWNIATVGGTTPGDKAAYMNFYNYYVAGKRDQLISPVLDLSGADQIWFSFQHAYAKRLASSRDSLIIFISADCGSTWTRIFRASENGSGNFATHAQMTDEFFPTATSDWCGGGFGSACNILDISPWAGNKNVQLKFESYYFLGNDLYIDNVHVFSDTTLGRSLSGVISYPQSAPLPLNEIHLDLLDGSGSLVGTTNTNEGGFYNFTGINNGSYTLDASTDKPWGGVTAADVLLYKKHIAGISSLSGIFLSSGDVNNTGSLTAADVLLVKKRIGHIIDSFEVGDWLFDDTPVQVTGNNVVLNFNGLCYGDANASYTPPLSGPEFLNTHKSIRGLLTLLPLSTSDRLTDVAVMAEDLDNTGAFQFTVAYDPLKLHFSGSSDWYPGVEEVTIGQPKSGVLTFVWAADQGGVSLTNTKLCNLHFQTTGDSPAEISFSDQPTPVEFSTWDGEIAIPALKGLPSKLSGNGIAETETLHLYPNPAKETVFVDYRCPGREKLTISLINTEGITRFTSKEIEVTDQYSSTIDLRGVPAGIYLVRVKTTQSVVSERLVIMK